VCSRHSNIAELYDEYRAGLELLGAPYEVIFVLDGPHRDAAEALRELQQRGESIAVIRLTRSFGEATALMAGFEHARGSIIVTLPAYHQIEQDMVSADGGRAPVELDAGAARLPRPGRQGHG
jgi:glycosyltransferase involved in cell wall biosynthesis